MEALKSLKEWIWTHLVVFLIPKEKKMVDEVLKLRLKLGWLGFPCLIKWDQTHVNPRLKHDNDDENEESWRMAQRLTKILKNSLDECVCVLGVFLREFRVKNMKCMGCVCVFGPAIWPRREREWWDGRVVGLWWSFVLEIAFIQQISKLGYYTCIIHV